MICFIEKLIQFLQQTNGMRKKRGNTLEEISDLKDTKKQCVVFV